MTEPKHLTSTDQRLLALLVANDALITRGSFSSQNISERLDLHQSTISRALTRLEESGFLSLIRGVGRRPHIVKGLTSKAYRLLDGLIQSRVDLSKEESEVAVPEITTGDTRPWMANTVEPRPWESKHPSTEELERIRELVKPRDGESVYEAVHALYQYACQK